MGWAPYSPRPWDDNLFDYCGTRFPDGTSTLFFSSIRRQLIRLLRYSIFGWDKLPISQEEFIHPWDDKLSTTPVLDLWMGQAPYFPSGTIRPWGDKLSTTTVLDVRMGQDPYLLGKVYPSMRRQIIDSSGTRSVDRTSSLSSSIRRQLIDYFSTRSSNGTTSLSPRRT